MTERRQISYMENSFSVYGVVNFTYIINKFISNFFYILYNVTEKVTKAQKLIVNNFRFSYTRIFNRALVMKRPELSIRI